MGKLPPDRVRPLETLYQFVECFAACRAGAIDLVSLKKYDSALKYQKKALKIRKQFLGESHPNTVMCYNNIGEVYQGLSDFEKMMEHYRISVDIYFKYMNNLIQT